MRKSPNPRLPSELIRGPNDQHQELVIRGPFRGYQTDIDHWLSVDPTIARDVDNVDCLFGELRSRPGSSVVLDTTSFTEATVGSTPFLNVTDNVTYFQPRDLLAAYTETEDTGLGRVPFAFFFWGRWILYEPNAAFVRHDPAGPPTAWQGHMKLFDDGGTVTVTTSGPSVTGAGTDFTAARLVGGYFTVQGESGWTKIIGVVSATVLTLEGPSAANPTGGYRGSNGAGVDYLIALPIVDEEAIIGNDPAGTEACRMILSDPAKYYLAGSAGGSLYTTGVIGSVPVVEVAQQSFVGVEIHYVAESCAIFDGRLVIASTVSYDGTGAIGPNGPPVSHRGRIVFNHNDPTTIDLSDGPPFSAEGAGFINTDIGRIRSLFVMRGALFAQSDSSIARIIVTGDPSRPYVVDDIITMKQIAVRAKPVVVDGQVALIAAVDAVYTFDGARMTPISSPITEDYMARVGLRSKIDISTPNRLRYDDVRRRVFVSFPEEGSDVLINDQRYDYWTRYDYSAAEAFVGGIADWADENALEQDSEFIWFTTRIFNSTNTDIAYVARRSLDDDAGTNIRLFWGSHGIDFGESRHEKTIKRFRFVYKPTIGVGTDVNVTLRIFAFGGPDSDGRRGEVAAPENPITVNFGQNVDLSGKFSEISIALDGVNGREFRFELDGSNTHLRAIKEIGIAVEFRPEGKPL